MPGVVTNSKTSSPGRAMTIPVVMRVTN